MFHHNLFVSLLSQCGKISLQNDLLTDRQLSKVHSVFCDIEMYFIGNLFLKNK